MRITVVVAECVWSLFLGRWVEDLPTRVDVCPVCSFQAPTAEIQLYRDRSSHANFLMRLTGATVLFNNWCRKFTCFLLLNILNALILVGNNEMRQQICRVFCFFISSELKDRVCENCYIVKKKTVIIHTDWTRF